MKMTKDEFVSYLNDTLIPDLRESGQDATADDLATAIEFIEGADEVELDDDDCENDEPWDGFRDDVDADADVLRMAGWGTDEDYGFYG